MPKLHASLKVLAAQTKDVKAKVHAVVSSVVIAYVFTKYHVFLNSEKCEILLKCLRLPSDEEVCSEYVKTIKEFDENIVRYVDCDIVLDNNFKILNKITKWLFEKMSADWWKARKNRVSMAISKTRNTGTASIRNTEHRNTKNA